MRTALLILVFNCALSRIIRPKRFGVESSTCMKYKCSGDSSTPCVFTNSTNSTYFLTPCSDTSPQPYCDTSVISFNVSCSSTAPSSQTEAYPGEPCDKASCVHGQCLNNYCFGGPLLSECTDSLECNPGLRCSNGECTTLLRIGESGCTQDFDCVLNAGCNDGKCVKYLTLPIGSKVTDCNTGENLSLFCESFSCAYNSTTEEGNCINPFTSESAVQTCSSYETCIGTSVNDGGATNYTVTTSCECGMNEEGDKYCFPNDGDLVALSFIHYWKKFMDSGLLSVCNTARRFHQECFDMSSSTNVYAELMSAYSSYFYFPSLQNASSCVQPIFFPDLEFSIYLSMFAWILYLV